MKRLLAIVVFAIFFLDVVSCAKDAGSNGTVTAPPITASTNTTVITSSQTTTTSTISITTTSVSSITTVPPSSNPSTDTNPVRNKMRIKIGTRIFTATLYENATATAFKSLLPMTINMSELNGNEKYSSLSNTLPTNASNPGRIQSGDLMIYGSNTLVLFYKSFSTSYSYTRLGRLDDVTGLTDAVGAGSVTITFELE